MKIFTTLWNWIKADFQSQSEYRISGKGISDIETLAKRLGLTVTETLRWAVGLLMWGADKIYSGSEIGSIDRNGKFTPLITSFGDKIRPKEPPKKPRPEIRLVYSKDKDEIAPH